MGWRTPEQLLMGAACTWLLRSREVLGGWSIAKFEIAKQKLMVGAIEIVPFLGVAGLLACKVCSGETQILSSISGRPVQTFSHTLFFVFLSLVPFVGKCASLARVVPERLHWRENKESSPIYTWRRKRITCNNNKNENRNYVVIKIWFVFCCIDNIPLPLCLIFLCIYCPL